MGYSLSFEKLEVYQLSRSLVKWVYRVTSSFPEHQRFSLINQLQRAAVSVASNIAEGSGRQHSKDKVHFIHIAYGSLMEVYCQLQI
ncbi:MAG: four helix bundle protein [Bacteroidales bacterium]|nr:four helix bundle protein [Bacteroidales bacterium]